MIPTKELWNYETILDKKEARAEILKVSEILKIKI